MNKSMKETLLQNAVEAQKNGARRSAVSEILGVSVRTMERWEKNPFDDGRTNNRFATSNALTSEEEQQVIEAACSPECRDMSPNQIVPILAERALYLASECTFFRILKKFGLLKHRSKSKAPQRTRPEEITARAPNQVWAWDISILLSSVRGAYFYLYLIVDIWDRCIVGWAVQEKESGAFAADLLNTACIRHGVTKDSLTVHQDNGGPMISFEFLAALSRWGKASYSRPGVSDDNPFSESQFRTLKYRPDFPARFETMEEANDWMEQYVLWCNSVHRHSGIGFVTPLERRKGEDKSILEVRRKTYAEARAAHPERWSGNIRKWERPCEVTLNPRRNKKENVPSLVRV